MRLDDAGQVPELGSGCLCPAYSAAQIPLTRKRIWCPNRYLCLHSSSFTYTAVISKIVPKNFLFALRRTWACSDRRLLRTGPLPTRGNADCLPPWQPSPCPTPACQNFQECCGICIKNLLQCFCPYVLQFSYTNAIQIRPRNAVHGGVG